MFIIIVMNMDNQFLTEMRKIVCAPAIEQAQREEDNDPKLIYRFYDSNKALRVLNNTLKGLPGIGDCFKESQARFKEMKHRKQAIITCDMKSPVIKGYIFHCAIVYYKAGEWRYETYSNGSHLDVRLGTKLVYQPWLRWKIYEQSSNFNKKKFTRFVNNKMRQAGFKMGKRPMIATDFQ